MTKVCGIKHLIQCHCILPQFRDQKDPIFHYFTVFSTVNENDNVELKYAQCNNCGIIHKITEIGKSEIITGRENSKSIRTIDDICLSLPEKLVNLLKKYEIDLPTWEQCEFIYTNQIYDEHVILTREVDGSNTQGKLLRFKPNDMFLIEAFDFSNKIKFT